MKVETDAIEIVQVVFGCKWSLKILNLIRQGICRPGAIEENLDGLTSRVKNYTFRRMVALGLLKRVVYPKVPPHVEYHLTPLGLSLIPILDSISELQCKLEESDPIATERARGVLSAFGDRYSEAVTRGKIG